MTIRVTELDHIVLRVRNLDESLSFYEGLLGLEVVGREEFSSDARPFLSVRVGSQLIDLWPDESYDRELGSRAGGLFHLCLRIAGDLEADVMPVLRGAGIECLEESPAVRFGATGYGRSTYVRDRDGYIVELKEDGSTR
jgi:catechol 2,3-dioxygenase-like lactoylglutathione lyase family enzyme